MTHSESIRKGLAARRAKGLPCGVAGKARAAANVKEAETFAQKMRPHLLEYLTHDYAPGWENRAAKYFKKIGLMTARGGEWQTITIQRIVGHLGPQFMEEITAVLKERDRQYRERHGLILPARAPSS